jgi:hypothetical protein
VPTLILLVLVAGLLATISSYTFGAAGHILLVMTVVLVFLRIVHGRNPFRGWTARR